MEETISLEDIFDAVKKRLWLIVLVTLLATAVSGFASYFIMTPVYKADTQILVQSDTDQKQSSYSQIQTNLQLINTYSVIMKSPAILQNVADKLDLDQGVSLLKNQITVSSKKNSQVVNISVQNDDPQMAAKIANSVASVFQSQIAELMNVNNVSILSKADPGPKPQPISPNPLRNMLLAFVVGLMIGLVLAFVLEYFDNTIKSEQDIEKLLELPVLGAITEIDDKTEGSARNQNQTVRRRQGGETYES